MKFILKSALVVTVIFAVIGNTVCYAYLEDGWGSIKNAIALKIGSPKAFVNLEEKNIDSSNFFVVPIVKNDRALLPIRFVAENFGAKVDWESETNTAVIAYKNNVAKITANSDKMYVNGIEIKLDVPAEEIYGRVYIPLRRLCEDVLAKKVFYDRDIIILSDEVMYIDAHFFQKLNSSFKNTIGRLNYMVYYGKLDEEKLAKAKTYDLVILHPLMGDLTRQQVQEIRKGVNPGDPNDDVLVLGYIAIGEDLRTCSLSDSEIAADPRFKGDGTGPRIDPRGQHPDGGGSLMSIDPKGSASPGGSGFASYYLDDNNLDGIPDRNKNFNGSFVNAGDPAWFDVIDNVTIDSKDNLPGLKEILSDDFGRGLGCDGVFLDTIDTCAPNSYTDSNSFNQSEFEWTAPGFAKFIKQVRDTYQGKYILQNRGLFFFDSRLPHYKFCTRENIDFLMFESYRLDSNPNEDFNEAFFHDNKYAYMPKIMAEASRADGFKVLSLGYAEGDRISKDTLLFKSQQGLATMLQDIKETQDVAGFNHYITDRDILLVNDFVKANTDSIDITPPIWSSTYNASTSWPPVAPAPRMGAGKAIGQSKSVILRWDIALDKNKVKYVAYYQNKPFDFQKDPKLANAEKKYLIPKLGSGYENGPSADVYPFEDKIENLAPGETYYFVIRAVDSSPQENEDDNQVFLTAVPLE